MESFFIIKDIVKRQWSCGGVELSWIFQKSNSSKSEVSVHREKRHRKFRASEVYAAQGSKEPSAVIVMDSEKSEQECRLLWPPTECERLCPQVIADHPKPSHHQSQSDKTPAQQPGSRPRPSRGRRWGWWPGILVYAMLLLSCASPGLSLSPSSGVNSVQESGVCTSMDIRNKPESLKRLEGCRVIEGFLQIVLIDHANETSYDNYTFPELREITGYLMLYRAYGLTSLAKLFPNLAVIRGQDLFENYALIIYQCKTMREVGLHSLTDIQRGAVRIQSNINLCYVKTVDWDLIASNTLVKHYIHENKPENECPVCPGDDGVVNPKLQCPEAPEQPLHGSVNKKHLCWSKDRCQKVCKNCGNSTCFIDKDGEKPSFCCDDSCLGGCYGSPQNCTVCRDLSIGDYKDRKCIRDCPNNTFKHYKRRCITDTECRSIPKPKGTVAMQDYPFKPFNGVCTMECPHGFNEKIKGNLTTCEPCQGTCKKTCEGIKLDSIALIQKMKGCTHIAGSLSIESIKGGGSIVKELEEGVGLIEEISGILKIVRCFPLVSLNFFKKLKVIGGISDSHDVNNNSSFYVSDNQNLQELWDWDTHGPIDIQRGELFFHLNPKLCLEKIEPLKKMAKETKFSAMEVVANSNGDKVACNVTSLDVTVVTKNSVSILLRWPRFELGDERALLGYVIHYIEAPTENITFFDGRDACRNDGWTIIDVSPTKMDKEFGLLTHLKPYTKYAVYVKTETVSTERLGAQSNIMYVRTLPGQPSEPNNVKLMAISTDTLVLSWSPPLEPNGNITRYQILVQWEEDKEEHYKQRNYCSEPLGEDDRKQEVEIEVPVKKPTEPVASGDSKCACQPPAVSKNEEEVLGDITFENQVHNRVYHKKPNIQIEDINRHKRDLEAAKRRWTRDAMDAPLSVNPEQKPTMRDLKTLRDPSGQYYNIFATEVGPDQRTINITNLRHYASHSVGIWACREVEKDELENTNGNEIAPFCSIDYVKTRRTLALEGADDISRLRVLDLQANHSLGIARLGWLEPTKPNGLVLTYHIQYRRLDIENPSPTRECITKAQFVNAGFSYTLKNLNPGNYSVRVMSTSLGGVGNYSAEVNFYIESDASHSITVVLAVIGGIMLALTAMCVGYFIRRKYFAPPSFAPTKMIASVNPEYVSSEYVPDEWEVPGDNVELIKELGQGAFGMVYEGIAKDISKDHPPEMRCAVKTINKHATERERIEFLNEASVMKAFDTAHVVRLLGVVSRSQPTYVIMELMANGDLKSYLRSHRPDAENPRGEQPPTLQRLLQMAVEIADGMAYLAAKKFVHRDLAARNCMVAEDLTVKVGDFGMTRDIYETDYCRKGSKGLLPVRWMSPESLKDGVFTTSSDVWSYGVVLWEMATLASQPYQGLSNDQVLRYVIDGGIMERPENCPDRLYQLMQLTWYHRPSERPTFLQLVSQLESDIYPKFKENSFFHSTQGQELLHQSQSAQLAGVREEPAASTSGARHPSWTPVLASLDSDSPSSRPGSQTSYRVGLVSLNDRVHAEPHETEALVLSQSAPPPKVSPPQSSSQNNAPDGYLPRGGNNGNPSSLHTSHC